MIEQRSLRSDVSASGQAVPDVWRKEIHAQVARYRTRRGRRIEGAFSMRFPFPPATKSSSDPAPAPATDSLATETDFPAAKAALSELKSSGHPALELVPKVSPEQVDLSSVIPARETEPETAPPSSARPRPRVQRKVIAFPRPVEASMSAFRLADPVLPEQPRILDIPEELEAFHANPFLDGLQFGPHPEATPTLSAEQVEFPVRPATISQRIVAALLDGVVVAAAFVLFAVTGHVLLGEITFTKPVLTAVAAIPALFWAFYQYLMQVYSGATLGMKVAGLRLHGFDGRPVSSQRRRARVLALYLSTASVVMGLLWAFVDVDALCWHDRITRTYLAGRQ